MKKLWKKIRGLAKLDSSDVLLILGTVSAFYGIYCIYPPVAFIVLGVWAVVISILIERGKPNG